MPRISARCACLSALLGACAAAPAPLLDGRCVPPATSQVVLSLTDDWGDTAATVTLLQRDGARFVPVGGPIAACVGRSGLGWGLGLHRDGDGPQKHEGDARAPAGVFVLGPAFGYAPSAPPGATLPYREATDRDYFVDDAASPAYNQWQRIAAGEPNEPAARWGSSERMRRDDALYEFGLVVGHNTAERVPGRGSAIFVHVWNGAGSSTSGCTAMARDDLLRLLAWLRPEANPLLVQMPRHALPALQLAGSPSR